MQLYNLLSFFLSFFAARSSLCKYTLYVQKVARAFGMRLFQSLRANAKVQSMSVCVYPYRCCESAWVYAVPAAVCVSILARGICNCDLERPRTYNVSCASDCAQCLWLFVYYGAIVFRLERMNRLFFYCYNPKLRYYTIDVFRRCKKIIKEVGIMI